MKIERLTSRLSSKYSPMLSKDIIDLVRSGIVFPVILTFLMPLLFLYAVTWFVESVMLWNFSFSFLFYAAMVGFFCTLLYSWLSNIDISECYNSCPYPCPISNCVINLAPDKRRVFKEAFRVLKPGGRLMVSDIVLLKEFPEGIKNSIEAYIGCL